MSYKFSWNEYADQPHNVALRKERLRHHLKYASSYFSLTGTTLRRLASFFPLYRKYRKKMYHEPVSIGSPFALSVSPHKERPEEVIDLLKETGVRKTLVRIPSWERAKLDDYENFCRLLLRNGFEVTAALLQQRDDVLDPLKWQFFIEEVYSRFKEIVSYFEIGHAWNRTKWGVWDFKEYLGLALPALDLSEKYRVKLVGPAVIDFEFHLYLPVLKAVPFEKVSSLLYVDRMGAPESRQFGWDTSKKVALLKAVIDSTGYKERDLWITEVNWPLEGTGKYSPAAGKPNVTEEEQADYLVRYYLLCLASGFVERVYWWQLVAPGYGLVDSRPEEWRRRPGFYALKTMAGLLDGTTFKGRISHPRAFLFSFQRGKDCFAVCWAPEASCEHIFSRPVRCALDRGGKEIPVKDNRIRIDASPKYVFFK
jgi:hypothetical protein